MLCLPLPRRNDRDIRWPQRDNGVTSMRQLGWKELGVGTQCGRVHNRPRIRRDYAPPGYYGLCVYVGPTRFDCPAAFIIPAIFKLLP